MVPYRRTKNKIIFLGETVIDVFMFLNELDLLEIRLNSLAPHVERFVLCESPITHTGRPKPLYFAQNKTRFKDFNITHLIVDDCEKYVTDDPWTTEGHQRDFLIHGLDVDPETIILLSDLDEIPDLTTYPEGAEGISRQMVYNYALNVFTGIRRWHGTIAIKRKNITTLNEIRQKRLHTPIIPGFTGWHFSYVCPVEQIIYKLESWGHQEFNTEEIKGRLKERVKNLVDPYGRRTHGGTFSIEMPSGPEWLLKNKDKYKHLFYGEI
jgi:beta-1,4-mannosyl-glycoprotein beta-1,4-N-acetylglucosaminyltransferase